MQNVNNILKYGIILMIIIIFGLIYFRIDLEIRYTYEYMFKPLEGDVSEEVLKEINQSNERLLNNIDKSNFYLIITIIFLLVFILLKYTRWRKLLACSMKVKDNE